jgi:hypothetical protein
MANETQGTTRQDRWDRMEQRVSHLWESHARLLEVQKKLIAAREAKLLSDKHRAWDEAEAAIKFAEQLSENQASG